MVLSEASVGGSHGASPSNSEIKAAAEALLRQQRKDLRTLKITEAAERKRKQER